MQSALGPPFGTDVEAASDGNDELRKRAETLFHDFAKGSETVLVRDLPDMFDEFQRIQGQPFFQPRDHIRFLDFAASNGDIPVHSHDLISLVVSHEAARSPCQSPAMEQQAGTDTSSEEDAEPGTLFKGRATGSPSFIRPRPPRLRGRHSSPAERTLTRSPTASAAAALIGGDVAYVSSPLSRSREASASSASALAAADLVDRTQRDLAEANRRIAQLEEELAEQAQNLDLLKQQLRDDESKLGGLEQLLHERASTIDKLNEQLTEREQKLEKLHGLEDNYETRMFELQEHTDELASQLRESAKENKELRVKSQSRQTYIERLESEVSEMQKKRREDDSAYRKLRTDHDSLKKDHSHLQKEREDQCDTTERIRQQLLKETERVERKQEEVDRLAFQVQEKEADMARADRRIDELESQLEPLEEALADSKSANSALQTMIETLRERESDADSILSRHRRLSSEMGDVTSRSTSSLGDGRPERSNTPSAPPSEPDYNWDSEGDGLSTASGTASVNGDDDSRSISAGGSGSKNGSIRSMKRAGANSPISLKFPTTPTLTSKTSGELAIRATHDDGAAGADAAAPPTSASSLTSASDLTSTTLQTQESEAATTAATTTMPPASPPASDKGEGEEHETTPKMLAAATMDEIAPLELDASQSDQARPEPPLPVSEPLKAKALMGDNRPLLAHPKSIWSHVPALDRILLRRTEIYLTPLAIVFGIVLGTLMAPVQHGRGLHQHHPHCRAPSPTAALSKEEVYAFHTANTMSMPYAFAPDFGEEGLFSPQPAPKPWYARLFGVKGGSQDDDFFIPT